MTLFRQLIIGIALLFMVVFAGIFVLSVHSTRVFLASQLQSHAQDAATSLGLSLSPHAASNDVVTMTSMVDAIFDSGYYRDIRVEGMDGKALVERTLPVQVEDVPQWFVDLVRLDPPLGKALLMAGWQRAGSVSVRSNPGIAYAKLWQESMAMFWWLLAAAASTLGLGWVMLRIVLRPLRALEAQAEAICRREYPVQQHMPRTQELRSFVQAMNRMVIKVKGMFDEQTKAMEKMRIQVYMDQVTSLGNRRYFEAQLQNLMSDPEQFSGGTLFMLALKGFKEYNDRRGYQAGDELLRHAARLLTQFSADYPDRIAARLTGADFALAAPNIGDGEAAAIGKKMAESLQELYEQGLTDSQEVGSIGVALYRKHESVSQFLAKADRALRTAQSKGGNAWHVEPPGVPGQDTVFGARNWADLLNDVIAKRRITLLFQPVISCASGQVLHYEVLLRIAGHDDQLLSAGVFMPYVNRLGLHTEIDQLVVSEIIARLMADMGKRDAPSIAINLLPESVHDRGFADWLYAELKKIPEIADRLIFEASEYGVTKNLDSFRYLVDQVGLAGAKFSLDHFGRGFTSFGYLSSLKIHYLKVDGSYIRHIDTDQDNQFFVEAVCKIAHGLDIEVIAESVETEAELEMLKNLKVRGLQGFLIGEPKSLP